MDSWLKTLYPDIQIPESILPPYQPAQQGIQQSEKDMPNVKHGIYFGGGGVNYSAPIGDGQFDGRLKANQLMMQWQNKLSQIKLDAVRKGIKIDYIRYF